MPSGEGGRRTDELQARHRRIWWLALLISLGVHFLIFIISGGWREPPSPFAAAGPRADDHRAAPAGGGVQVLDLVVLEPEPAVVIPQPTPIPVPEVVVEPEPIPEVAPPEVELPPVEVAAAPGTGGGEAGEGDAKGIEGGTGAGDGGTESEGRFRVTPPAPRGLILPPGDRPGKVRGKEVTVWVFVTEKGEVVPDSTRLLPPTGDSKFDERLRRQAAQWVFQPARRAGVAVAEWFRYTITL